MTPGNAFEPTVARVGPDRGTAVVPGRSMQTPGL